MSTGMTFSQRQGYTAPRADPVPGDTWVDSKSIVHIYTGVSTVRDLHFRMYGKLSYDGESYVFLPSCEYIETDLYYHEWLLFVESGEWAYVADDDVDPDVDSPQKIITMHDLFSLKELTIKGENKRILRIYGNAIKFTDDSIIYMHDLFAGLISGTIVGSS